jgi:surfeit locus 1 family protein
MPRSRSRQIAVVIVALGVAGTCVALGSWQLRRLEERRTGNATILRRRAAPAVSIEQASRDGSAVPFRPVTARGRYDTDHEVLVFGRTLNGASGHDVVTPLVLDDGSAVLVVRGWVPFEMQTTPVREAAPVTDEVEVEGFLIPDEGDGTTVPDEHGIVGRLDVAGIGSSLPYDVLPLAVQLTGQVPAQRSVLPELLTPPDLSEGPHLSYAIQWFSFAAVALIGGLILIRRDRRPATPGP